MPRINNNIDSNSLVHLLNNGPLGIIITDKNMQITYWSEQAEAIFEWKEEEVLHRNHAELDIVYEEDMEKVATVLHETTQSQGKKSYTTNRNKTKSGRVIVCDWYNSAIFDEEGSLQSILCLVFDVTGRAQMEHELSLIYNSAIDPMWLVNIEGRGQFRFQSINKSFTTVTGLQPDQVVGRMMEDVLPQSSHELVRNKYNEATDTGNVIDYVEIAVHPAGKKYGEIRVIPIKNREGKVIQILGIANDITEKQALFERIEKEREEVNRKLATTAIKSQELERSKVSQELHDHVNQVLTTVKLYTELCASGTVDINVFLPKCTTLLNETINEIRDLSKRLSAPSLGEVGVVDTIQDLVDSINDTGRIRIRFDTEKLLHHKLDSELHLTLYRIAQEHLTNVIKHANATEVLLSISEAHNELCLAIKDNGNGFDPEQKRKGIGITNMTSRARLLNGTLHIESEPGKGCSLRACIPIKQVEGISYPANESF